MSSIMLEVSWRWYVTDQFWKRGRVNPFGVTATGAVRATSRENQRAGDIACSRIWRVRIERRVLILTLRAGELIVEAQAEGQRQPVANLEFVVEPCGRIRFVERRIDRDDLTGLL